ncbi:integrative conjugal element protein [Mycoplasma putrefaciens]|uniref:integrative conjugal element protein n=1 Tax=Mycoplasma putrefaciens TaxID=2123 RepID=UPI003DA37814
MIVKFEFAKYGVPKKVNKKSKKVHNYKFYNDGICIDYITRIKAVYIQNNRDTKEELKTQFTDNNLSWDKFLQSRTKENFLTDDDTKTGLYRLFASKANDISIKTEKQIVKQISKKQHIWEMTINPGQLGIDNFAIDKEQWNTILNQQFRNLFRANNIDPEKIIGHWAIHSNTKYPHIHLSFWEKYPDINGNYRSKGSFKKETINKLKSMLAISLSSWDEYNKLYVVKNSIWDSKKKMKEFFNLPIKSTILHNSIETIQGFYKNSRNKNYALSSNNEKVNQAIWDIFNYVKEMNPSLNQIYSDYLDTLEEVSNTKYNTTKLQQEAQNFVSKEMDEFETQIGNIIVKDCLEQISFDKVNSYWEIDKQKELEWLLKKWQWEFENIQFWKKIEALKKFNKNIKYAR